LATGYNPTGQRHARAFYVHRRTACIGLIAWAEGFGLKARRVELGTLVLGALGHLQHSSPPQHKATVMPDTAQGAFAIDTDSPGTVK
jgi:hypothetical protein